MGDLTPHFSQYEFDCHDGTTAAVDCRLLSMLEAIRCVFESPVVITSGYRSPDYNASVGGAANSFHTRIPCMAADIQVAGATPDEVYDWADRVFPVSGIGLYTRNGGGWIHIDARGSRARWTG